jgi:starvation-inducible outer membrane lipoprotein
MHHQGELYGLHPQNNMPKSLITTSLNLTACILTPNALTDYDAHQATGSTSCMPASHANATLQEAIHASAHARFISRVSGFCDWFVVPLLGTKGTAAYMHASCGFYALIGWMCPFDAG